MLAQIDAAHGFIVHNGIRIAFGQYRAIADDIGAVANAEGFTHVVIGNNTPMPRSVKNWMMR